MRMREMIPKSLVLEMLVLESVKFFPVLVLVWKCAVLQISIETFAPAIRWNAQMGLGYGNPFIVVRMEL